MIALFVVVPFLLALLLSAFLKNGKYIAYVAIAASLVSIAMLPFIQRGEFSINWFSVSGFSFNISTYIAQANIILLVIVLLLAPIIFFYSLGFISVPSERKRFYIEMLAFTTAMLTFAVAGNFIVFFIAWEFLSVMSYLLIGFWYKNPKAARAARKAITIVFIGDLCVLGSLILFWNAYGSLEFSNIIYDVSSNPTAIPITAVMLLIIAVFTKSAQFPFHEWLPDAMEGPAPVSAFLHSATMVKAGVFAAIVLYPIFFYSKSLQYFLIIGILTAVIATANAMRERHIKKVLAYSTIQELALMLASIGVGAVGAALYFFFAQAFYKALLFFSSGVMMKSSNSTDLGSIYGLKHNKLIYITTLFGVLSLAGFIPFDGFFSSVVVGESFISNIFAYIIISIIGIATSFYIFRWFFISSRKTKNSSINLSYDSQPRSMVISMTILAAFTLIASITFFIANAYAGLKLNIFDSLIEIIMFSIGFAASYFVYVKGKVHISIKWLENILYNSPITNTIYLYIAIFVYKIAEGVDLFDIYLNDLFDWFGHLTMKLGNGSDDIVNGQINAYAVALILGLVILGIIMVIA